MDAAPIRKILGSKEFDKAFGGFIQEYKVKTAPKGFSKEDPNIDLIRLKSFFVTHKFSDKEVTSPKLVTIFCIITSYFAHFSTI